MKTRAKIILKRGRANPIWHGHPWVYSGAVERTEGQYEPGDLVDVYEREGQPIGHGLANPKSQIIVRMLTRTSLENVDGALENLIQTRIHTAWMLRQRMNFPNEQTNAFRLINSEGDGLPGLTVDWYNATVTVMFTTLGMKRLENTVFESLKTLPIPPVQIIEIAAEKFAALEGFTSKTQVIYSSVPNLSTVSCREAGIELEFNPLLGQKTGLFLDQRENRVRLGNYAQGAKVLDLYSYMGGFALQALKQGAREVTCVDSSARALERAQHHAQLNELSGLNTVESDTFRFLEQVTPYAYDVVVVDPPKFARAHKDLTAAAKGYRRLNALALNAVSKGGILASCSCSQLIETEHFERILAAAAQDAGRRVTILETRFQGPDHPILPSFSEGRYLKFVLMGVE